MKIADNIEMLTISGTFFGQASSIHPVLIRDEKTILLVDAGFPGQLPQIRAEIEKTGTPFEKLNKVILTHQDIDHIGSLSQIVKESSHPIEVLTHEVEKPYINGEKVPIKVAQLKDNFDSLPEEMRAIYVSLKTAFNASRVGVDTTLTDGEELPYCGGITVIHTPGHTPGHICLYLINSKTLIAGDALEVTAGRLVQGHASLMQDLHQYRESLKKLTRYDIQSVICYHGGLFRDEALPRILALAYEDNGKR